MEQATPLEPTLPGTDPPTESTLSRPVAAGRRVEAGEAFGRYLLRRELGRGGMGVVHEAWDPQLGRAVALKMLSARAGLLSTDAAERLLREARSAARLRHPGIVAIHDVGEDGGRPYFTMDLVEGRSLEEWLSDADSWASFPMRRRVEVVAQIADALGFAHAQGIVHRDVKPSNVIVDPRGRAMLMDFGLAKELSGDDLGRDLTLSGAVLGTPRYMSPEQAEGSRREVGPSSDVFSAGVLLYRALTGVLPFEGQGIEAILAVLSQDPAPPGRINPRVHRDLETIAMRCLEKDPSRRFPDGAALAAELRRFLDGEPILSRPIPWTARIIRRAAKHRAILIPVAAVVLLAASLSLALADRGAKADQAAHAEREKLAAQDRERRQAEAMRLLEQARAAMAEALIVLYDKGASYEELVRRADGAQRLVEQAIRVAPDLALAHDLLGRIWEVKGWEDRAEAAWRDAVRLDPRFGPAHFRLGRLYLERAFVATLTTSKRAIDWKMPAALAWAKRAEAEVRAALEQGSGFEDPVERSIASAMVLYASGDHAAAARACEEALAVHGRSTGREGLLWLLSLAGTNADALPRLDQAIAIRPKFPLALFTRATLRDLAGDTDGAFEDFTEAIACMPRLVVAYSNRGILLGRRGDADGALEDYERALAIDPAHPVALVNRAYERAHRGDLDGAIADCTAAIQANPACGMAYVNRSDAWLKKGDVAKAIEDANAALAIDPRDPYALSDRANAKVAKGDLAGAMADVEAAMGIDADDPGVWIARGSIRREKADFDGAIADFDRAVSLGASPEAHYNRAAAKYQKGDREGAIADYDAAIRIDKRFAKGYAQRGTVRAHGGDYAGGRADLEEAVRLDPRDASARTNLGALMGMSGEYEAAGKQFDAAIEADPKYAEAWRNRGYLKETSGDFAGAVADYDKALELMPRHCGALAGRGRALLGLGEVDLGVKALEQALAEAPPGWPDAEHVRTLLEDAKKRR